MTERITTVANRVGLHARPAAIFAEAASNFPMDITIAVKDAPDSEAVDASSMLSLMGLGATQGTAVVLRAEGSGADEALDALVRLLEKDHDAPQ
jgi:phosphocarrier protein HPr